MMGKAAGRIMIVHIVWENPRLFDEVTQSAMWHFCNPNNPTGLFVEAGLGACVSGKVPGGRALPW